MRAEGRIALSGAGQESQLFQEEPRLEAEGDTEVSPCSCASPGKLLKVRWFLTPAAVKEKDADAF